MEEKTTESICKPVANSAPQGMGINDKQMLSNMSWKYDCSGHLTFPLYCYELKSGNSAWYPKLG